MAIQITPLSEGVFTIGHDKVFVPFDVQQDELHQRPTGSLLVEIQPFLVQVNGYNLLLDTGLGYHLPNGELQIHANLARHGLQPEDIHMVLMSHLHKDHAGGIYYTNQGGVKQLSFPNAHYYVSRHEFDFAMAKGAPSYVVEDFSELANSAATVFLDEQGDIGHFIEYETVGGHCPYHIVLKIHDGHDVAFFGGDVVPQLRQLKTKYVAKYDYDGKRSMELRQQFAQQGKTEGWQFLFYHDVREPVAILHE